MPASMCGPVSTPPLPPRPLRATEIVTLLSTLAGWNLQGDGADVAICKTFRLANFHATMAFVNAVAFVAHQANHHPQLTVHYGSCTLQFHTHEVAALTERDFACAAAVDALLAPGGTPTP